MYVHMYMYWRRVPFGGVHFDKDSLKRIQNSLKRVASNNYFYILHCVENYLIVRQSTILLVYQFPLKGVNV